MSAVKRLEKLSDTPYMKAKLAENSVYYVDATYTSHAYQCLGCGLVWDRKSQAQQCEQHGHKASYQVLYCNGTLNGNPINPRYYDRRALRREPLSTLCQKCGEFPRNHDDEECDALPV